MALTLLNEADDVLPLAIGQDQLVPLVLLQPQALEAVVLDEVHPDQGKLESCLWLSGSFTFYLDPHSFWNFIFLVFLNQNYRSSDPYHFEYLHVRLVILHNLSVMTGLLFFLLLSRRLIIVCWWASSDHPLIKHRFIDQTWPKLPTISFMVCLVGNIKKIELI